MATFVAAFARTQQQADMYVSAVTFTLRSSAATSWAPMLPRSSPRCRSSLPTGGRSARSPISRSTRSGRSACSAPSPCCSASPSCSGWREWPSPPRIPGMSRVRAVYAFVAAVMKSSCDRTSMFFMAVLPVVVIVVIGTTYGGTSTIRLGIVASPGSTTATALRDRLADEAFELSEYSSLDGAASAVRRGKQDGAIAVVDDTTVQLITAADQDSVTIRTAVSGVVADLSARLTAAGSVATDRGPIRRRPPRPWLRPTPRPRR
ncbi:MAG: hypothetical protein R2705_11430 [Ilumatobacteraceae bacterium]